MCMGAPQDLQITSLIFFFEGNYKSDIDLCSNNYQLKNLVRESTIVSMGFFRCWTSGPCAGIRGSSSDIIR